MSHDHNAATAWVQLPDMTFETPANILGATVDGGTFSNPMWANVGGSLEPTGAIISGPLSYTAMVDEETGLGSNTPDGEGLWVVGAANTSSNWNLQSHWFPLAGNYRDFFEGTVTGFPVVDYDPEAWRFDTAMAVQSAFADANPDVLSYEVEWEDYDTREPVGPFGAHHDRQLLTYREQWAGEQWAVTLVDEQLHLEPAIPPDSPGIEWIIPAWEDGSPATIEFDPPNSTSLVLRKWSIASASNGDGLGSFDEFDDVTLIDDAVFEANARLVTDDTNGHGNRIWKLGMPLWAIPDFAGLINATRIYDAESRGRVTIRSTFTPPRIRVTYSRETLPNSYRRIYPRDDGLAGGARRNYPPSRATQSGNRNVGGYL